MAVILLILKIIGIILLILLGLILLALALVLFVPVRYRVSGDIGEKASVAIAVTWLLHLVRFDAVYENGSFDMGLCILGIRRKDRSAVRNMDDEADEGDARCKNEEQMYEGDARSENEEQVHEGDAQSENEEQTHEADTGNEELTEGRERKFSPIHFFSRIREFLTGIRTRYKRLKKSIYTLKLKLTDIKNMFADENNKKAVFGILTELKYLLCHFKFRKLETNLTFSMGDPALTGQVLGGLCMLPFLYQYQVQVYPDFASEETYVRGTFEIRGRMRGIHILVSVVRLLKKKEFRNLLKKLLNR